MIRDEDVTKVAERIVECLITCYQIASDEMKAKLDLPESLFAVVVKEKQSYLSGVKVGAIVMMAPLFAKEADSESHDDILEIIDAKVCDLFEVRVREYAEEQAGAKSMQESLWLHSNWYSGEWLRRSG